MTLTNQHTAQSTLSPQQAAASDTNKPAHNTVNTITSNKQQAVTPTNQYTPQMCLLTQFIAYFYILCEVKQSPLANDQQVALSTQLTAHTLNTISRECCQHHQQIAGYAVNAANRIT